MRLFWLGYRTLIPNSPITQINAFENGITHFVRTIVLIFDFVNKTN